MEVYIPARGGGKSHWVLERTEELLEQGYTVKEIRPGMFVFVKPESAWQTFGLTSLYEFTPYYGVL